MPQVSIQIANRTYELACGEGEEARVQELAAYVDGKVVELRKQMPGAPEIKLMIFASLLLPKRAMRPAVPRRQPKTHVPALRITPRRWLRRSRI